MSISQVCILPNTRKKRVFHSQSLFLILKLNLMKPDDKLILNTNMESEIIETMPSLKKIGEEKDQLRSIFFFFHF